MNAFAFKVIDAINREGIGNEAWGLVEEVDDTVAYFGTREEIELKGQWAYVYADKNDFFGYIDKVEPTRVLHVEDCQLLLYKLDQKAVRAAINRPQARSVAAPAAGGKNERYERHKNWRPGEIRTQYW